MSKEKRALVVERCDGNLIIRPIDDPVIHLKGSSFKYAEDEDGVIVQAKSDLSIYVFQGTTVEVRQCMGNVTIKAITSPIKMGEIHGQLTVAHGFDFFVDKAFGGVTAKHLSGKASANIVNGDFVGRHLREIQINEVHGDVRVKHSSGNVNIQQIMGDSSFSNIDGGITIGDCMHDIHLRRIEGLVDVSTRGDIHLKHSLPQGKHHFKAQQDVVLYWPNHFPLSVTASFKRMINRYQFDKISDEKEGSFSASLGEGGPHLNIEAGAALVIKPLNRQSRSKEEDFDFHMEFEFGPEAEAFGNRMSTIGEEIASKVSQKMAEISSQLEGQFKAMRKKEEAVRKASERMTRYGVAPPPPPQPQAPPRPVDQEVVETAQLKVLEMLEDGKISVEEANILLKALE